jgi:hypothetical protein
MGVCPSCGEEIDVLRERDNTTEIRQRGGQVWECPFCDVILGTTRMM